MHSAIHVVQTTTVNSAAFDIRQELFCCASRPRTEWTDNNRQPRFQGPLVCELQSFGAAATGSTTTFEIAYVGSVSRHLLGEMDLNMPTLAARESNQTLLSTTFALTSATRIPYQAACLHRQL